jgi:methylated-DNA-[protein]-cysteine S-methyltransferase
MDERIMNRTLLKFDTIPTPIGDVWIAAHDGALVSLDFHDYAERFDALLAKRYGRFVGGQNLASGKGENALPAENPHGKGVSSYALVKTPNPWGFSAAIQNYFAGDLRALDALPVSTGGTAFQQACWQALRTIAPGKFATYAEQASRIGNPRAVRAVGAANGQNPVAIALPCHRVKSAQGLTGYAGGLWRKEWLLRHEGAIQ